MCPGHPYMLGGGTSVRGSAAAAALARRLQRRWGRLLPSLFARR
jgi:hypothetical protein